MRVKLKIDRNAIAILLAKSGMNLIDLAEKSNLSRSYISLLVNGHVNCSPKSAKLICSALECDFDDIFHIEGGE
ncbi:MAG: helix-turn-helix transcriptional regulator [Bacillaceae bacterium]|nr:helix-turn-helix transcriptional regulator [Bacillaceae bacterium]